MLNETMIRSPRAHRVARDRVPPRPRLAQAFPTRTVRIVIPFPPGGTSDILARTLAQKAHREWGQQVIAENRPGAAGNVACEFVAKQKGDPHTLLINTVGTHAINPAIYPNLPFDPLRDFTLITNLVNLPTLLIVHPSVQATSAQELIALARRQAGRAAVQLRGSGSQPHLTAEMFKSMAGVDLLHVPYKGAGPQLLAAHQRRSRGDLRDRARGGAAHQEQAGARDRRHERRARRRAARRADAERGGAARIRRVGWNGLVAPAGIPKPIVDRIHAAVSKIYSHARHARAADQPRRRSPRSRRPRSSPRSSSPSSASGRRP
jgi:tripartite-type tricarboxylate transporter receptor subunit TctC